MKAGIQEHKLDEVKRWFAGYVRTFKFVDEGIQQNIDLKAEHTMRVCSEILSIGKQLGLGEDELRLAELVALLHDAGRFEQISRYQTFMDSKSVDHAELGIRILKHFNVLASFDTEIREIVYSSVHYHSKPLLPNLPDETMMFYIRLIRDADKLDILRVVTDYYHGIDKSENGSIVLNLPDTPGVSEKVYNCLMDGNIVNISDVNNLNDFKLLQAGWIFDINFQPTLRFIRERRYLEMIHEIIPATPETEAIFTKIFLHRDSLS